MCFPLKSVSSLAILKQATFHYDLYLVCLPLDAANHISAPYILFWLPGESKNSSICRRNSGIQHPHRLPGYKLFFNILTPDLFVCVPSLALSALFPHINSGRDGENKQIAFRYARIYGLQLGVGHVKRMLT
jgi:hypothetical protein